MQKNIELTEATNPSEVRLTPRGSVADKWRGTRRYDVVRCIGQGEMGVVYEAFDRQRRIDEDCDGVADDEPPPGSSPRFPVLLVTGKRRGRRCTICSPKAPGRSTSGPACIRCSG